MPIIVVLAIGLDSVLLRTLGALWNAAGYIVSVAGSIGEAIDHFKAGDFDLVLLGNTIPPEKRRRLTSLIRSLGSHVPVAFIAESPGAPDSFADATLRTDPKAILAGLRELVSKPSVHRSANERAGMPSKTRAPASFVVEPVENICQRNNREGNTSRTIMARFHE